LLEKRYGGEAPDHEAPWWPPKMIPGPIGAMESKLIGGSNAPGADGNLDLDKEDPVKVEEWVKEYEKHV
jgi:hypothetical protein